MYLLLGMKCSEILSRPQATTTVTSYYSSTLRCSRSFTLISSNSITSTPFAEFPSSCSTLTTVGLLFGLRRPRRRTISSAHCSPRYFPRLGRSQKSPLPATPILLSTPLILPPNAGSLPPSPRRHYLLHDGCG